MWGTGSEPLPPPLHTKGANATELVQHYHITTLLVPDPQFQCLRKVKCRMTTGYKTSFRRLQLPFTSTLLCTIKKRSNWRLWC